MRHTIAAAAACAATVIAPASAAASTATIPNVCLWSATNTWEQESLTLSASATPERATPGTAITLTGTTARFLISPEVVKTGYALGVLKPGENTIAVRAWLALRAGNTQEGVQVRETTATARTTIATDANQEFVSATPIDVQAALGDSAWTAGASFPTAFTQAEAGTLPALPAGPGGAPVTPLGSAYFLAGLGPLNLQIDCQPGTRAADRSGPVPAPAAPFATVLAPNAVPSPAPPRPALSLRSTKLRDANGRIAIKLSCAAATCSGKISIQTSSKVTVGRRKLILAVTRSASYTLNAGTSKTVTLKTSTAARQLLRKRSLSVRVTTAPTAGDPLTRKLKLASLSSRAPT